MRVLAHPDPWVLEAELLDRIEAAQNGAPGAPVLVVVPTRRLAEHVLSSIAQRSGARLGVEVHVHRSLARAIAEDSRVGAARPAPAALLEAVLDGTLRRLPRNRLASFAAEHPGASGAILSSLRDLRESGITPEEAEAVLLDEPERSLASIYGPYARALVEHGIADDAALVATALPYAEAWARRFRAVLHHGAYELIGIHLDLVRAVDRGREVTYLLPFAPDGPAYAYAGAYAARHLIADEGLLESLPDRPGCALASRLRALYDEARRLEPVPPGTFTLHHAQGSAAEMEQASRHALRVAAASPRPDAAAVVARTLAPYAGALDGLCARSPRVFAPAAEAPLRREPAVAAFLLLLHTVAEEFPRGATAELLQSPRVRWDELAPGDGPFDGSPAEEWSRRARLLRGLEGWTHDLPDWAAARGDRHDASRSRHAARIARGVEALAARVDAARPRSWSSHADHFEGLFGDLIALGEDDAAIRESVLEALAVLRRRETDLGETGPVSFPSLLAFFERALDDEERPILGSAPGGVPILDAAQARGLTFESVWLVGLNAGVFPRPPREDPFLGDRARQRLRDACGRPFGVKSEGADEERLLLALVLGAGRRSIHLSWLRADETGRTRASSIAQREIARVLLGRPDGAALREKAHAVPAHPAARYRSATIDPGLLRGDEAAILLALEGAGDELAGRRLVEVDAALRHGLEAVRSTESFDPAETAYDGRVGRAVWPGDGISVSALEALGRCALQYFFRYGLRIRELEDEAGPFAADRAEVGRDVHGLLEELYATLTREGLFPSRDIARSLERARLGLAGLIEGDRLAGTGRIARRVPVLGAVETARWRAALEAFVEADLRRLHEAGSVPLAFEANGRKVLDIGEGRRLEVHGRFDRVVRQGDGTRRVGDYKTSGDLAKRVSVARILRGEELQVPLYRWIEGAGVEVLGVGPEFSGVEPSKARRTFDGFDAPELEEGFRETIRVIAANAEGGCFPIRVGAWCRFCPYAQACRRNHPPTRERHAVASDVASYRLLEGKGPKAPRLADVRETRPPDDEDGS